MTRIFAIAGLAAGLLGSGCAQQAPMPSSAQAAGRQCFLARNVNSWSAVADNLVDIEVGASNYYRLGLSGACPNIDWSRRLALRTTGGSSWICDGLDAEVIVLDPVGGVPQRCFVTSITPLSKAQYLATRHR